MASLKDISQRCGVSVATKGLIKAVMCSESEFEACWTEMVSNLENAGLKDFEKTYTEWLADKMGR